MSKLVELNGFERGGDGVYHADTANRSFNYSDGEEIERRLQKILTEASDLSSGSAELMTHISDWPTEYHLSSTRANLLRSLDLSGVRKVLELGCGCGSITRYLGEQSGIEIDSIEGSPIRAALAALRCRDQENITISTANFNEVEIPEDHYDLVLFVGVTEYAGRFSDRDTDEEALQDLLSLGRKAAKDSGVVLVAIENRLGLKYLLGANEDHYAQRFVGLDDYPDSTGIRTYSKPEWQQQIGKAGFNASRFLYPFPDYKVPTLIVSDDADHSSLVEALRKVRSRDYSAHFDLGQNEYRAWQGLLAAGNLDQHANSFLILLTTDKAVLDEITQEDIQAFGGPALDYLQPDEPVDHNALKQQTINRLNSDIARLQQHAGELEDTLKHIEQSKGWRLLRSVRRLFGKSGS